MSWPQLTGPPGFTWRDQQRPQLHCGDLITECMASILQVLPLFNSKAPLRLRDVEDQCRGDQRAPAVQRRAPLRQQVRDGLRARVNRLLPPFTGGLHCGSMPWPNW